MDTPEGTAAAFVTAWERRDPTAIYALLTPARRLAVSAEAFAARYRSAIATATVLTATASLQAVLQEGEQAQAACRLSWQTALVGEMVTDTIVSLSFQQGRWWLDGSGDLIWPGLGEENYFYMEHLTPARANIYDRNNLALAAEGTIVTVGVVPQRIQDEAALLSALSLVTGMDAAAIRARYANRPAAWWTPIADISGDVAIRYASLLLNTPGIDAREKEGRTYMLGGAAPHVVGWVAQVPAEELERYRAQGYRGDEWVGVAGLEAWGEPYLAGRHGGILYLLGPTGECPERRRPPRCGAQPRHLHHHRPPPPAPGAGHPGGAPRGDCRAGGTDGGRAGPASGPSFDPNILVNPSWSEARNAVLANPNRPLFNRATQGLYPTGSVFKIVTLAAALERGGMTAGTTFYCPGYWDGLGVNYRKFCWKEEGHGEINLRDALAGSCNVTFYNVGMALHNIDPAILPDMAQAFGLGMRTGIVGVPEEAGQVPGPASRAAQGQSWYVGDTVNLAIGQGDLRITPLQVARMVAAVANGGTLYRPYVVARIAAAGEAYPEVTFAPEAVGTLPISAENLAVIQDAMLGVTREPIGTAHHRFIGLSIPVAGKTGSAEAPGINVRPHSWFAGYAPANAPEIVVVVMVENAGEGSEVAAPMARQVVEAYYGLALTPLPPEAEPTPTPTVEPLP
jgi:cell division protein FtsI/penicillin-binding protein 2